VRALDNCRVLDFGIITAGAATSALLADLGAEVIKIESPTYRDPFRIWTGEERQVDDRPPLFRATNRNKAAISIDLKQPRGREVMLRLVAASDVVVENFRRGVLPQLGLSFEELRRANGRIVLASVSSHGETGPDSRHVSYGSTLEAVAGLAWNTGYAGEAPVVSGRDVNYPDQVAAIFAAGMIATALRAVRDGGPAVHLDLSQRDLTSFLVGDTFVAASTGDATGRQGNAREPYLLQDCFLASDGAWVALSVRRADVERLAPIVGAGPRDEGRRLRERVSRHVAAFPSDQVIAALRAAGLAAAPVLDGAGVMQLEGTAWTHALSRADGGVVKGFPFQIDAMPLVIESSAPSIGADTRRILAELGGYAPSEIVELAQAGVIELGD